MIGAFWATNSQNQVWNESSDRNSTNICNRGSKTKAYCKKKLDNEVDYDIN